jgi:hypothetical protein
MRLPLLFSRWNSVSLRKRRGDQSRNYPLVTHPERLRCANGDLQPVATAGTFSLIVQLVLRAALNRPGWHEKQNQ